MRAITEINLSGNMPMPADGEFALGEFRNRPEARSELDDVVPRAHDEDVIATE